MYISINSVDINIYPLTMECNVPLSMFIHGKGAISNDNTTTTMFFRKQSIVSTRICIHQHIQYLSSVKGSSKFPLGEDPYMNWLTSFPFLSKK